MHVRPYAPADRDGVRHVCFDTGFMGDSAVAQFADRDAFADLFCQWYLDERADTCWVVDDGGGRVVGYLLGSPDGPDPTGAHARRWFVHHALRRGLLLRPGTGRFLGRLLVGAARHPSIASPPGERCGAGPVADLHVDLLAVARGRGFGAELVGRYLDVLATLRVAGVRLATFGENAGAIAFFESQGFARVGAAGPNPGFRMPDGSPCTVVHLARRLASGDAHTELRG